MNDADEANKAIEAMNGSEMGGRGLKVNEARPVKIAHPGNPIGKLTLVIHFQSPPLADFFFFGLIGQNLLV